MDVLTDRTPELEQKLKAIYIDVRDGCSFWKERDGCLVHIRQCWYCAYSQFDWDNPDINQRGLCKFKR